MNNREKLKTAKIKLYVFEVNSRKLGDAKIFQHRVFVVYVSAYEQPRKIKTAKIKPHDFEVNSRKFGDAKIFQHRVLVVY